MSQILDELLFHVLAKDVSLVINSINFCLTCFKLVFGNLSTEKQADRQVFLFLNIKFRQISLDRLFLNFFQTGKQNKVKRQVTGPVTGF